MDHVGSLVLQNAVVSVHRVDADQFMFEIRHGGLPLVIEMQRAEMVALRDIANEILDD